MAKFDRIQNPIIEVSRARLQANEAGLDAFKNGMGLSMHWGLYSVLGLHEWCLKLSEFDPAVYAETMKRFNPVRFNEVRFRLGVSYGHGSQRCSGGQG